MLDNRDDIDSFTMALASGSWARPVSYVASLAAHDRPEEVYFGVGQVSTGRVLVSRSGRAVTTILFGANEDDVLAQLRDCFPGVRLLRDDFDHCRIISNVITLIENPEAGADHDTHCDTARH